jgi:hypothetical protein
MPRAFPPVANVAAASKEKGSECLKMIIPNISKSIFMFSQKVSLRIITIFHDF